MKAVSALLLSCVALGLCESSAAKRAYEEGQVESPSSHVHQYMRGHLHRKYLHPLVHPIFPRHHLRGGSNEDCSSSTVFDEVSNSTTQGRILKSTKIPDNGDGQQEQLLGRNMRKSAWALTGCSGSKRIECNAFDNEFGNVFGKKIYICHYRGGDRYKTLCIAEKSAPRHMRKHPKDYCGECDDVNPIATTTPPPASDTFFRLFIEPTGMDSFNSNKAEAKEWFHDNIWNKTLGYAYEYIEDSMSYDEFFDGFMEIFHGESNLSNAIDFGLLEAAFEERMPTNSSRALSVMDDAEALRRNLGVTLDIFNEECFTLLVDVISGIFDLIFQIMGLAKGLAKGFSKALLPAPESALAKEFYAELAYLDILKPNFIVLIAKAWVVSMFDGGRLKKALIQLMEDLVKLDNDEMIDIVLDIIAKLAAIYLSKGLALLVMLLMIAKSLYGLYENYLEVSSGVCWDCTGDRPPCNEGGVCMIGYAICEDFGWKCNYRKIECAAGWYCDITTAGTCKVDPSSVPCVAVIDRDKDEFLMGSAWARFRKYYPHRPFCLVVPEKKNWLDPTLTPPQSFLDDPYTVTVPDVDREPEEVDWFGLCGLDAFRPYNVQYVALFIHEDKSSDPNFSMDRTHVKSSHDKFIQSVQSKGFLVKEAFDYDDNWIEPFMTTLGQESLSFVCDDGDPTLVLPPTTIEGKCATSKACRDRGMLYPLFDVDLDKIPPGPSYDPAISLVIEEGHFRGCSHLSHPDSVICCANPPGCIDEEGKEGVCIKDCESLLSSYNTPSLVSSDCPLQDMGVVCCLGAHEWVFDLKLLDCEHFTNSAGEAIDSEVCAKFTTDSSEYRECWNGHEGCPEFHIRVPKAQTIQHIDVTGQGELKVASFALQKNRMREIDEPILSWKPDSEVCITDNSRSGCQSHAEKVKGMRLYMNPLYDYIRYEIGHPCYDDSQCESGLCGPITDMCIEPGGKSTVYQLHTMCLRSAEVCANFVLRQDEKDLKYKRCWEKESSDSDSDPEDDWSHCPTFQIIVPASSEFKHVSIIAHGADDLLVYRWNLLDVNSGRAKRWWLSDVDGRCVSDRHDADCFADFEPGDGVDYPVQGVRLFISTEVATQYSIDNGYAVPLNEDWEDILYEDGHDCTLHEQCESNNCALGVCKRSGGCNVVVDGDSRSGVCLCLEECNEVGGILIESDSCDNFSDLCDIKCCVDQEIDIGFGEKIIPNDPSKAHIFGHAVAIHGNTAVIGDSGEDDWSGSVSIYTRAGRGSAWGFKQKLKVPGRHHFGTNVALSDNTILVSGHYRYPMVWIFAYKDAEWKLEDTIERKGDNSAPYFGSALAVSETYALIGAYGDDDGYGSVYAYFYHSGASKWVEFEEKIVPKEKSMRSFGFGRVMSLYELNSNTAIAFIGAMGRSVVHILNTSVDGMAWEEKHEPLDLGAAKVTVDSIALAKDTAIIGDRHNANEDRVATGSVLVFTRDVDGIWTEDTAIYPDDGNKYDFFGYSVALDKEGDMALIGSRNSDQPAESSGAAYIFRKGSNGWNDATQQKLLPKDDVAGERNYFGHSVSLSQGTALVGTAGGANYAYSFDLIPSSPVCNDNLLCTIDRYDEIEERCIFTPIQCDEGEECDPNDGQCHSFEPVQKILPYNPSLRYVRFGRAVAIHNNTAVIGDIGEDNWAGSVSIYSRARRGSKWGFKQKLKVSGDRMFGNKVAIYGKTILVSGSYPAVWIFVYDGAEWKPEDVIEKRGDNYVPSFGYALAVSETFALIGATGDDDGYGSVYAYHRLHTGKWVEFEEKIVPKDRSRKGFGSALSLYEPSPNTATAFIVGGVRRSVHIFNLGVGIWEEKHEPLDLAAGEVSVYARSIALARDTAIIGDYYKVNEDRVATGAALIFTRGGNGIWTEDAPLYPEGGERQDWFGYSVALDEEGEVALIGARNCDDQAYVSGSAYIFRKDSIIGWEGATQQKLLRKDEDAGERHYFGHSVSLSEGTALVGTFGVGNYAYSFDV